MKKSIFLFFAALLLVACEAPPLSYDPIPEGLKPLPSDKSAIISIDSTRLKLVWTDNSNFEEGFIVYRREEYTNWAEVGRTIADETEYFDSDLSSSLSYYYRVGAYYRENVSVSQWVKVQFVEGEWQVVDRE